jgi:hypothetical protein
MLNNNTLQTSLMFLGIISLVLIVRMFTNENTLFVNSQDDLSQVAGVNCTQGTIC